jgi:16S rRNA (guanine(966)-N(2))-methyltransferase RsmD
MRIIRGSHKGRQIHPPNNLPVRPTTDLAKESLFNILENNFFLEDLQVLDLFSGTGSISYEFASRGSKLVVAVDNNGKCIRFIAETAARMAFTAIKPLRADAFAYLKHTSQKFDLIFADPPYDLEGIEFIPQAVFDNKLLAEEGWLVLEHPREKTFGDHPCFFELRKYGKVHFSFFKSQEGEPGRALVPDPHE